MTGIPSVSGTTYSSVLVYGGSPQCSRNYLLFCPRLRRGPQCSRNYLLFCPRLRQGSVVQQELLTLLSSSTTGVPSVAGTTYSSLLVYDGDPSVSGTTYSSVLVYGGSSQCSKNYLLFCPRLRRGSLVQQELFTLLSSSTTGVLSVAGTTYSSVLVYDGGPLSSRNYLLFCPRLRRGPQCIRNYLLFCPRLRRESLVQQELLTLLPSSTTGSLVQQELLTILSSSTTVVLSVAGTTYSSVIVYDEGPQCSRNYILFSPRLRRGPQCIRNYLLFCPRLRRKSLVYQELLTLQSSSTTGVPSVAGTIYYSVLFYDGGHQCSRNYLFFCPRLRRGSLVQQELYILLSSSTTGVPSVAGTIYSSVLVYDGPQCSRNYLLFCPRLRRGPQCSRNYLLFCPRLRQGSLVQQELLTLLSSSTTGVPSVAGTTYSSLLVYDGDPSVSGTTYSSVLVYGGSSQCSKNYLLFCPRLRRGPLCSRNYLLFCLRLRRGSLEQQELLTLLSSSTTGTLVYQELLTLLSSSTAGIPSVATTT